MKWCTIDETVRIIPFVDGKEATSKERIDGVIEDWEYFIALLDTVEQSEQ